MRYKFFEKTISADHLVEALLNISSRKPVCLLDSCGVRHLGSRYLIAGISPLQTFEIFDQPIGETLDWLDEQFIKSDVFHIFTFSYEFGVKLENIQPRRKENVNFEEPDVFLAVFDTLVIYDYVEKQTFLIGSENNFAEIEAEIIDQIDLITGVPNKTVFETHPLVAKSFVSSNFTLAEYLAKVEEIKELIRQGETYQTNLTQQFRAELAPELSHQDIFRRLRKNNPTPFSAFIQRNRSTVISASPERFFKVQIPNSKSQTSFNNEQPTTNNEPLIITTSPIKGTRRRGFTPEEDLNLREELLHSEKDRAENIMIVDLLRNDLGRISAYGKISVEKLCELEMHPTLFHLVSTVNGELRSDIKFSGIIKALFPCGSITGAPKISTMHIIDRLETAPRGLSMGAIGLRAPVSAIRATGVESRKSKVESERKELEYSLTNPVAESQIADRKSQIANQNSYLDLSVAIRTITAFGREAIFNVGGGIVIDSFSGDEYEETLVKARALFEAINADFSAQ